MLFSISDDPQLTAAGLWQKKGKKATNSHDRALQLLWQELAHTMTFLKQDIQHQLSFSYHKSAGPWHSQSGTIPSTRPGQPQLSQSTWGLGQAVRWEGCIRITLELEVPLKLSRADSLSKGTAATGATLLGPGQEKKLAAAFSLPVSCHVEGQQNRSFLELNM